MSDKNDSKFGGKSQNSDQGISGLFKVLNLAIGEIAEKLEQGQSGTINRDFSFETEKGPMRAQAGIRMRMGNLDVGETSSTMFHPSNPERSKRPTDEAATVSSASKPISYDLFEENDVSILTADLPGVSRKDLELSQNDRDLVIRSKGQRAYEERLRLDHSFSVAQISISLRNGILVLKIPKEDT